MGIVPMLLAENRILNTEYLLPAGHHVLFYFEAALQ